MFHWTKPVKKRIYYKVGLVQSLQINFEKPLVPSRFDPNSLLLTDADLAKIRDIEEELIQNVAQNNHTWFNNCLTEKQIRKRFSSACMDRALFIENSIEVNDSQIIAVQLKCIKIFKNHWTAIWVADLSDNNVTVEKDDIGLDKTDLEDATFEVQALVEKLRVDINTMKNNLDLFFQSVEAHLEKVEQSTENTADWQKHVDALYKKISLYESGIIIPPRNSV